MAPRQTSPDRPRSHVASLIENDLQKRLDDQIRLNVQLQQQLLKAQNSGSSSNVASIISTQGCIQEKMDRVTMENIRLQDTKKDLELKLLESQMQVKLRDLKSQRGSLSTAKNLGEVQFSPRQLPVKKSSF
mmetsp:Transcript_20807/g.32100  ORF Transcript_20807/g.32100 Transcript_20807/m.32100 type:complete len:131 (+) Transcript_20807:3342-3734(+)